LILFGSVFIFIPLSYPKTTAGATVKNQKEKKKGRSEAPSFLVRSPILCLCRETDLL